MCIEWNKVTWYSKLLALILLFVLPIGGFVLGRNYEKLLLNIQSVDISVPLPSAVSDDSFGYLSGHVTLGPICPVERVGNPCKPTPEMYAARKIFIYTKNKAAFLKAITPNGEGNYRVSLAPGEYVIDMARDLVGNIQGVPQNISIKQAQTVRVDIVIDTGIR